MPHTDESLKCLKCPEVINIDGDAWDSLGNTFTCPKCGTRQTLHVDENADGTYWFAFDLE